MKKIKDKFIAIRDKVMPPLTDFMVEHPNFSMICLGIDILIVIAFLLG